jgi:putative transposase
MPRPPRISIPEITFHIVQRGNDRSRTFFVDDDYRAYLNLLNLMSARYATDVHAYVLMTNHVHLLMTSKLADGVSRTMQQVAAGYSRRINDRHQRTGTLWEGRFRSSAIDSEFYCLACYRYIELNPVRAGLVQYPGDYRWSSYAENAGLCAPAIVKHHPCYLALADSTGLRRERYADLVDERISDHTVTEIRRGAGKGLPVGSDGFKRRIESELGRPLTPRKVGRPRMVTATKMGSDPN